jgi:hypothetical protein
MATARSLDEAAAATSRHDAMTLWGVGCHPAVHTSVNSFDRLRFASPASPRRERQVVASYADALAALLAEETGATPDDVEPRLAAETMMAFHRSLIEFARRRALSRKSSASLAAEIRAAGERALTLLEAGLGDYGRHARKTAGDSPQKPRDEEGRSRIDPPA